MNKVIKIKITQPNAHYRLPFAFKRRFTYPIPPFSTFKGLLCNLLGIRHEEQKEYLEIKNGLSIFICGKYEALVNEYVWFRNLSIKSHEDKYGDTNNRTINGKVSHIGGQIPVNVDTLDNTTVYIYLHHKNNEFQKILLENIKKPINRNTVLHLGRAEDWIVLEEVKEIELEKKAVRKLPYFAWIPEKEFLSPDFKVDDYEDFYKNISGNLIRQPTFYTVKNNQRHFYKNVTTKLFEGGSFRKHNLFVDIEENNLPIIFTHLKG